jgi:hypothetical protein
MRNHKPLTLLLALAMVAAMAVPSRAQSSADAGAPLTADEKAQLEDLFGEFCVWLNNAIKEGIPLPKGNLELRSGVVTPAEVQSMIPRCDSLMRLMQRAADANKTPASSSKWNIP